MTRPRLARVALPLLGLCLLALSPIPPTAATATGPDRVALPVLTSVSARHVGNVDRVVFRFTGGVPTTVFPEWVDTLVHDGSGLPVRVAGAKVLLRVDERRRGPRREWIHGGRTHVLRVAERDHRGQRR